MTSTTETNDQIRRQIQEFAFTPLFVDSLGWDHARTVAPLTVVVGEATYTLRPVAQKRGVVALRCDPDARGGVPDYATRKRIEEQVRKTHHEHFIIYTDRDNTMQVWQWVKRQPGKPAAYRDQRYYKGQSGERLAQRLAQLYVDLDVEDTLGLTDVIARVQQSFDVDKVTKRFYDRFKTEHKAFLDVIAGIAAQDDCEWYASLMLNRLMFTYFIQKKGFLAGDAHYMRHKLAATRARFGADQFHSFYREFLLHLFHDGLGAPVSSRTEEIRALIGDVPYLNGGLFERHRIEHDNDIAIPDTAFERVFDFFDAYSWSLDDRPDHPDNEINPDVLGYIFEKYINQKQMGAYYTKEDITGYISRNTILPFLLDATRKGVQTAFDAEDGEVWRLLRDDPDRYIYDAVCKGVDIELPADIAAGISDVAKRGGWNRPAAPEYALPTETWREHVARRQRCLDLRAKLAAGEVHEVNDLITYNLDITQFAQDVIERCEGPEVVRAFWKALVKVSVLDPTCGSGAFLFAALRILEPLYDACLTRMEAFVTQFDREGERQKGPDFREILADVTAHPSRAYFIRKRIILNNLYGVDIMEEAVEIAKLRLFLALVSQAPDAKHVEPLPDIDFNIRAGNTLVGFATYAEAERAVSGHMFWHAEMPGIKTQAEDLARLFALFREQQTAHGGRVTKEDKATLRDRLAALGDTLDRFLAAEYGIDESHYPNSGQRAVKMDAWRKSHQPFHWFIEFYDIVQQRGGFDVIIGNPPYVEISDIRSQYLIRDLHLTDTGNLFSVCAERFVALLSNKGHIGIIVPISSVSTPRMLPLMTLMVGALSLYVSNFAVRPGKLFVGADMNLTIMLGKRPSTTTETQIWASRYNRWTEDGRQHLFACLAYAPTALFHEISAIPKVDSAFETSLLKKLDAHLPLAHIKSSASDADIVYYHSGGRYFRKCVRDKLSNEYKPLAVKRGASDIVICVLSSSLYYWYWLLVSDCYHVTKTDVDAFPVPSTTLEDVTLRDLAQHLLKSLYNNARIQTRNRADGSQQQELNFRVGKSKPIIDEIDRVLAEHYGFTDEELDFIINYDIKYRMGAESGDDDGDGEA